MNQEFLEIRNTLPECPRCGKSSLAQLSRNKYQCLWCGFNRDLSEPEWTGVILISGLIGFFALVFFSQG
jgi:ribosomal protein L37E